MLVELWCFVWTELRMFLVWYESAAVFAINVSIINVTTHISEVMVAFMFEGLVDWTAVSPIMEYCYLMNERKD